MALLRFDGLKRLVAARISRRAAIGGAVGGLVGRLPSTRADAAGKATPTTSGSLSGLIRVKVLTVTMYQDVTRLGEPNSGEAQPWIARDRLVKRIAVPGVDTPLFCDAAGEHCLVITGMGMSNAAATLMAVGLCDGLDLTRAYIMIAGVAGTPPGNATLGSAAWAEWVINAGQANLIDPRELPSDWLYPYFHLGCTSPWCTTGYRTGTEVFHLNPALTEAAYQISKGVSLMDSADAAAYRANFPDLPARGASAVLRGDSVASDTLLGGRIMSEYAQWWTHQWTGGQGTYVMGDNEDAGTLTALRRLADTSRIDWQRVMVLRTASDFDQPYPGQTALAAIGASARGGLPVAFVPAVENAYRVGAAVTAHILAHWAQWENGPPAP